MRRLAVFAERKVKGGTVVVRAGNAVENRDGSIAVYLDVLPLDGKLTLREAVGTERTEQDQGHLVKMLGQAIGLDRCNALTVAPAEDRPDCAPCSLHKGHAGEHRP